MKDMSSQKDRKARREKVAVEALESLAKSEQFNFRIDTETIKGLYAVAAEKRKPVGALVREWIVERLDQEQKEPLPSELMKEIHEFHRETVACLRVLSKQLAEANGARTSSASPNIMELPDIPEQELSRALDSLKPTKPGIYEIPEWMLEYLRERIKASC